MDTPIYQRGLLYTTHYAQRCSSFKKCVLCQACSAYNPLHLQCTLCEKQKAREDRCHHTEKQKIAVVEVTNRLKAPMFSPNYAPQTMNIKSVMDEHGRLDSALKSLPGSIKMDEDKYEETRRWAG